MTARPTFRNFFILIIILSSMFLSVASAPPANMDPAQEGDFSDINPTYEWATYIYTTDIDSAEEMVVDQNGDIIVVFTSVKSPDYSWINGDPSEIHVAKLTKDGVLVWQTDLEIDTSSIAAELDIANEDIFGVADTVAVDASGNIYVTGTTRWNYTFVAKIDTNGSVLWNHFIDILYVSADRLSAENIAIDDSGNLYIVFEDFELGPTGEAGVGKYRAQLAKVNSDGELEWVNRFAEFNHDNVDTTPIYQYVKVGREGIVVVSNAKSSWGEPLKEFSGEQDVSIAEFDSTTGELRWNTFLGVGWTRDEFLAIDFVRLDGNGNIYITGDIERDWGNPIIPLSGSDDCFLMKVQNNGDLLWNTFFGGTGFDDVNGMDIGEDGNPYLIGTSTSTWGEPTNPFGEDENNATFIAQFDTNGSLLWNSFLDESRFLGPKFVGLAENDSFYFLFDAFFIPDVKTIDFGNDDDDVYLVKLNLYGTSTTYRPPSLYVPDLTLHIPTPFDISTDPGVIGTNVFLAVVLMLPFAIAVDVFSKIFSANEEYFNKFALIAWIGRAQKWFRDLTTNRASWQGLRDVVGLLGVIGFYGLVFSLLDVKWNPFSVSGIVLFVSMAVAFGLVGLLDDIIQWRAIRKWGHQGEFTVRPANLFLAAASTTVSRLLALAPGLMFGSPEALKINEEELSQTQNHALARISMFTYVVIGLTAWLPTIATYLLQQSDIAVNLKNIIGIVEAFLLVIFAVALENVFVQLIGFSDGLGQKIRSWNKLIWGISLTFASFAFLHTLLNPRYEFLESIQEGNIAVFIGVTASFIVLTMLLQLYLRRKKRTATGTAGSQ